jgi:hypothetical protein
MEQPASIFKATLVCLVCLAPIILLTMFVAWREVDESHFQARATATAEAREVDRYGGGARTRARPIYEFRTAIGQAVRLREGELRNSFWGRVPKPEHRLLGPILRLRYDPTDPQQAEAEDHAASFLHRWSDLVFFIMILMVIFVGVVSCPGFGLKEYLRMAWWTYRLSRRGIVVEARIKCVVKVSDGRQVGGAWGKNWMIETQGVLPETGKSFECNSFPLPEDPRHYIHGRSIAGRETLPVLVDPKQPECNLLIAEFLPLLPNFGLRARADAVWNERRRATVAGGLS